MIGWLKSLFGFGGEGIGAQEAMRRIDAGAVLVDVREPHEFASGHAPQAHALPLSQLRRQGLAAIDTLGLPPGTGEVLLICHSGMRSRIAQNALTKDPARRYINVNGGMSAWTAAGVPMQHDAGASASAAGPIPALAPLSSPDRNIPGPGDPIAAWNTRYDTSDYLFGTAPNAFLAAQAHRFTPGMSALAVADGEGRNGVWMAEQGLDVLSVDASAIALSKARRLAQARAVPLQTELADLAQWDFGRERFDVIAVIFIQFADPALRTHLFSAMRASLKPGGILILQGYRPEQLAYGTGGPKQVENLYTPELLRDAFSGMEMLRLHAHDSTIEEGRGHRGVSALIDLVVRKP